MKLQNQTNYRNITACRLCESSDLRLALGLRSTPLGDRYLKPGMGATDANLVPLEILQCMVCGNYQTSSVIDPTGIYESYLSRPGAVNTVLTAAYEDYAHYLIEITDLKESDLVVELGSNDGLFASFFAKRGFKCLGVDPAKNLADTSVKRGVNTITDYFSSELSNELVEKYGCAKVIVANFMVANIDELRDFMTGVKGLLASDGVFAMETNYVADVISNLLIETLNHEHLSYFSVTSLGSFFNSLDLELIKVMRVPSKNGSLRCFIQHKGAKLQVQNSVFEARDFEQSRGLFLESVWCQFAEVLKHARNSAFKFCSNRSENGLYGYGTSIGATTILYQLSIGEFISGLIDDDPYRQGLESPGYGIPTLSSEVAFSRSSSTINCVVLAPQYVNQIVLKNSEARDRGVKFARIWPDVEEVPAKSWWQS